MIKITTVGADGFHFSNYTRASLILTNNLSIIIKTPCGGELSVKYNNARIEQKSLPALESQSVGRSTHALSL